MLIFSKLVCPPLKNHIVFTEVNIISELVPHDIFLHIQYYFVEISVHDQLNPDVLRDMRCDEAYDVFGREARQECLSHGMTIVIFTV